MPMQMYASAGPTAPNTVGPLGVTAKAKVESERSKELKRAPKAYLQNLEEDDLKC